MGRFDFRSPGSAFNKTLQDALLKSGIQRRNFYFENLEAESRTRAMQRAEAEARRAKFSASNRTPIAWLGSSDRKPISILRQRQPCKPADTTCSHGRRCRAAPLSICRQVTADRSCPVWKSPSTSYTRRQETYTEQLARQQREATQAEKDEQRRFRDEQADAERAFRGEQAGANRDAAAERAQADRDMKLLIADMTRSGSAETRALGNELKQLRFKRTRQTRKRRCNRRPAANRRTALGLRQRDRRSTPSNRASARGIRPSRRGCSLRPASNTDRLREQWIQSVLRDESGAAIGADEEAVYFRTYFRQPEIRRPLSSRSSSARSAAETAMQQKVGRVAGIVGSSDTSKPRRRRYDPTTGTLR